MGNRPGRGAGDGREPGRRLALPLSLPVLLLPVVLALGLAWASGALDYGLWWLTNTTPPTVTLTAPPDTVRGQVPVAVRLDPSDRAAVVEAEVDGRPLAPAASLAVDTATLPDGEHQVVARAEDRSWRRNRASASVAIRSDNTPPRLAVEWRPERAAPGSTWVLRVRPDEPAEIETRLGDKPLDIQPGDGFGWAVVGFPPDAQPATLQLVVDGTDRLGNRAAEEHAVQLVPGDFPVDPVDVQASLLPLLGPEVRDEEDRRLAPTYARVTRPRLWEGRFLMPVEGPLITEFGARRSYNGGPVGAHHAGTDIAAPAGRAVLAPARGRVALVDQVRLRGRIAVLDHGLGVYTTYAHLSAVDVQPGALVERGQPFAKVGSTGLSTGPHLHWELWVGGANVDPLEWTQRDLP